jgi:hypothetical protein
MRNKVWQAQFITDERFKTQQGEFMKKSYLTAVLTLTGFLGIGMGARAQDVDAVVVTVPFEFVAGGATLPAGEYRVSRVNPSVNRELAISGYDKGSAFLLPLAFDDGPTERPTMSFEHRGDRYYLSGIKTLSGVYTIAVPRTKVAVAQVKDQVTVPSSGTK